MMEAEVSNKWLLSLSGHYPPVANFPGGLVLQGAELRNFVALWIAEGIPYAFIDRPGGFQLARERLAFDLAGVSIRDISVTGSGRIGYSMSPTHFGRPYSPENSDIDLLLVNNRWFETIAKQAQNFVRDYREGIVKPSSAREKVWWDSTAEKAEEYLESGYFDAKKIPNYEDRYPASTRINNASSRFVVNINAWYEKKVASRASVRVYNDWKTAIKNIGYNLKSALKYRK